MDLNYFKYGIGGGVSEGLRDLNYKLKTPYPNCMMAPLATTIFF